jgi:hypothetical protein
MRAPANPRAPLVFYGYRGIEIATYAEFHQRLFPSFETHRFALLLRMRFPIPHGEEHGNAVRLEP